MSRDNARTPVQWDDSPTRRVHHRDAVAAGEPRPRASGTPRPQRDDPTSVLAHYRRLIALRHDDCRSSRWATSRCCCPSTSDVYAFTRSLDGRLLLVVCNVSRTPHPLAELLPEALDAELVLGNLPDAAPHPAPVGGPRPALGEHGSSSSSRSWPGCWACCRRPPGNGLEDGLLPSRPP